MLAPWKKSYDKPRQHIKKQRQYFTDKGLSSQSYGFSSSHSWMWELDHKESWELKSWYFSTMVLEKTLESPLDCKETKQVNPKENQFWTLFGGTDAEAEVPILWPPAKSRLLTDLLEKTLMLGKIEGRRRRGWQRTCWMAAPTQWTWVCARSGEAWCAAVHGVVKGQTWLNDWTDLKCETLAIYILNSITTLAISIIIDLGSI